MKRFFSHLLVGVLSGVLIWNCKPKPNAGIRMGSEVVVYRPTGAVATSAEGVNSQPVHERTVLRVKTVAGKGPAAGGEYWMVVVNGVPHTCLPVED
jgi:hypothetical protein